MPAVVSAVLHAVLGVFIPSANLLVIIVICQLKKKRPSRNYVFILNLAAADLLVGMMCIGDALDDATDALIDTNLFLCLLRISLSITPCIGSILTLLLVSLDRYLAVKLPLHYPTLMSKKPIIFSLVVLWIISFLVGHMVVFSSQLQQSNYAGPCGILTAAKSDYLYIICFGIFVPALLILVSLHLSVGRIAYLQHKQIRRLCLREDTFMAHLRHFKALRTVLIVIICFILFWGPYYVTAIVKAACNSCSMSLAVRNFLFVLGESNSLINPFVYSLYSKDIRTQFIKLMKCKGRDQIKPHRPVDLAVVQFNTGRQTGLTSERPIKHDSAGELTSNSPSFHSSFDCKSVFSVS